MTDQKTRSDYTAANRVVWDTSAPLHENTDEFSALLANFGTPGFSCLDATETAWLIGFDVTGKSVAQICCNNGREILSIENMGAGRTVGFDQSGAFLAQARRLGQAAGATCEFVETDIYDIPDRFQGQFDLCVITIGVLGWMPDLPRFMAIIAGLLKPGGSLFMHETHPLLDMFEPGGKDPFRPVNSYFKEEPFEDTGLIVYDGTDAGEGEPYYWFQHPLGRCRDDCAWRRTSIGCAQGVCRQYQQCGV